MMDSWYLDPTTELTLHDGCTWIGHQNSSVKHQLKLGEAIAISFLSYTGNVSESVNYSREFIKNADHWVSHVMNRYYSYFGGTESRPLNFDWLDLIDFDKSIQKQSRIAAAPHALVWLVTLACNRRCPYCFYDVAFHSSDNLNFPGDAGFSIKSIRRMISEMRLIGSSELYLTGGEPLLRPDLIDIVEYASKNRVKTFLSTKYAIDINLAQSMKRAGLTDITYSLDAGSKKLADGLCGTKDFFEQAKSSLQSLIQAGFNPEVNAVLTRSNEQKIEPLIEFLVKIGVKRLSLSLFIPPPFYRSSTRNLISIADDQVIKTQIDELTEKWLAEISIRIGDSGSDVTQSSDLAKDVCDVGYLELHLLPDGTTSRCRYLPNESRLALGSLEDSTITDIWHSKELHELVAPSRSKYKDTACASCASFDGCNSRGRCYVSAKQSNNLLFSPDSFCKMGARI